jgi:dephospho-CoA kinase
MPIMSQKRWVVGLTGGIASGKSTVLAILQKKGIPAISSDAIAHACIAPGTTVHRAILRYFGKEMSASDGLIDRKKLAQRVFENSADRRALQGMVHPCVIRALKAFVQKNQGLIILEIPLLFESNLTPLVDEVIVVFARPNQLIQRGMKRAGWTRAETRSRLRSQWPLKRKVRQADTVFNNTGSRAELSLQVRNWLKKRQHG